MGSPRRSAEGTELERLYQRADRALYAAKRAGRDCVAVAAVDGKTNIIDGPSAVDRLKQLF